MKIKNMDDLRKYANDETIKQLFMEYVMILLAKSEEADISKDVQAAYDKGYADGKRDAELGV